MRLLVTYMELTAKPCEISWPIEARAISIRRERPSVASYLALYNAVGAPLQWDQRARMPEAELQRLLEGASTSLFIMHESGDAIGLCEFVSSDGPDIELTNFGLIPQVQGRKLGPLLLNRSVVGVWKDETRRIWLHTDTNDHPNAQAVYKKAGFNVFKQQEEDFAD
jgi:ribosomal protein S18 acetylase RimI-like enzyme